MRLVCPNCGAQYEVDDRVMPEAGRDVQCSACGHAWFQRAASQEIQPTTVVPQGSSDTFEEAPAPDSDEGFDEADDELQHEAPVKRELSVGVKSILQEEAQRELEARHAEHEQLETQPELGPLDDDDEHRQSIRDRMARMRGVETEHEADAAPQFGRGRNLLPDIEEINSTLDANHADYDDGMVDDAAPAPQRSGFRRGFMLMVLIALIVLLLYVYAPVISAKVPALKGMLDGYVAAVDQVRAGLDQTIRALIGKLDAFNAPNGGS